MKTGLGKLNGKTKAIAIVLLLVMLVDLSYISAVTGSIGNARMVLRVKAGDTINKTILVQNINNQSVDVTLFASGDLEKDIKITDSKFTLAPGDKKDARFSIKINKEGTFDSKINVQFYSTNEKQGIGLTSNIIVIAGNGTVTDNENIIDNTSLNVPDSVKNIIPGVSGNAIKLNPIAIALSVTGIVLLVFFVILISYFYRNKKSSYEEVLVKSREETKPKKEHVHK